jgi:hypothetical protein
MFLTKQQLLDLDLHLTPPDLTEGMLLFSQPVFYHSSMPLFPMHCMKHDMNETNMKT